jgi:hypothetical protein
MEIQNKTNEKDKEKSAQKETQNDMINCNGCQGEININSYRTYYTKKGIFCKCCVEKLPAED